MSERSSEMSGYEVLSQAFVAEGTETLFALLGDANMYWGAIMAQKYGVRVVHARHEHCAVAMADGYARHTGKVGVATVTCGPGFTQIMTALATAARGSIPLVVFAGDSPTSSAWYVQQLELGPLATATGARYLSVKSVDRMLDTVREAFYTARQERCPVVLGVPFDLQKAPFPWGAEYSPSTELIPTPQRPAPDPVLVDKLATMIAESKRPIILGGRGVLRSGAAEALEALAERCGALLATSLFAKGLFDHNRFGIGVAGAYASPLAREEFAACDLLIGVGAGLGHYTTEAGYLYPNAKTVQIDLNPRGLYQGLRIADMHIRADAKAAAEAVLAKLAERGHSSASARTPMLAKQIAAQAARPDSKEFLVAPGTVDPRPAILELDAAIPKDWTVVSGGAHFAGIVATHFYGRRAEQMHVINEFGAIGSAFPIAIGMAAARGDGKLMLIEGDGSLMMHIQELETIRRQGIRMLICTVNDGGYGAEVHKFRAQGYDPKESQHGRGDIAAIARGFGLRGEKITTLDRFKDLFAAHEKVGQTELWDLHVDDAIPSAPYRRIHFGEV
ncbi:MAG: acetolactate synthase large subunit [Betaproteobacteria bacterium]|nr:acetolactate synthase large subunit [Betaproteobacteria bacterium]